MTPDGLLVLNPYITASPIDYQSFTIFVHDFVHETGDFCRFFDGKNAPENRIGCVHQNNITSRYDVITRCKDTNYLNIDAISDNTFLIHPKNPVRFNANIAMMVAMAVAATINMVVLNLRPATGADSS